MRSFIVKSILASVLILILIFSPFAPGTYDNMAVMISSNLQIVMFTSLLFVPLGIAWLICELYFNKNIIIKRKRFMTIIFSISIICTIVACFVAIGGIGSFRGSLIFAIVIILSYLYTTVTKIVPHIKGKKNISESTHCFFPLYLVLIPLIVIGVRLALLEHAVVYSRNYVIQQSEEIIKDLEEYYDNYGIYPASMMGLWKDYSPGILGIEKFHYEKNGNSYNLFFEHFNSDLTAREIVMYNKLDEHIIRSHPSFIFSLSPQEYDRYRGYFAEYNLPQQNWKYYLFD